MIFTQANLRCVNTAICVTGKQPATTIRNHTNGVPHLLRWLLGLCAIAILGPTISASGQAPHNSNSVPAPGRSALPGQLSPGDVPSAGDVSEPVELPDAPTPAGARIASSEAEDSFMGQRPVQGESSSSQVAALPPLDLALWNTAADTGPESGTERTLDPSLSPGLDPTVAPAFARGYVPLKDCPADVTRARECRMHWRQMVIESSLFNAFENAGNLYTGYWYRWETTHGKWWQRYIDSAAGWRWNRWSDNNPFLDDYIAHPMMGAITNAIWIQNDPKGMTLEFANDRPYWRSRLRAMAWSTFYSFEWKLGPLGEASIGHNGDHYFTDKGVLTNETGWVELVTTPVGGLGWTVLEDYLDKHVVSKLEEGNRNPVMLTIYNFITPARGFANILRFRPPWYRDSRVVKTGSVWGDPGEGLSATTQEAMRYAARHPDSGAAGELAAVRPATLSGAPDWQGPGGRHEFGAWWGLSAMSGHIWGFAGGVKYMPVDLRYSYEFHRHHQAWTMRYSPEMTALALLDWPTPNTTSTGTVFNQRTRAYGSGISPVGFQVDFWPLRRVQPFFSGNGGFLYFDKRVLSPQGSQFMYTIDYGAGINIFHHKNQAITIGYRYQHLSNANISLHNPGTDANTFYVGVSRFRSRGDHRPAEYLR